MWRTWAWQCTPAFPDLARLLRLVPILVGATVAFAEFRSSTPELVSEGEMWMCCSDYGCQLLIGSRLQEMHEVHDVDETHQLPTPSQGREPSLFPGSKRP